MSFFPILYYIFNTRCCLFTIYMIPKCLNACIIASSFSGVHCGCLAFSDLARLKFSPTSSPHFFLICAIYSDKTLSPVCSSTYIDGITNGIQPEALVVAGAGQQLRNYGTGNKTNGNLPSCTNQELNQADYHTAQKDAPGL